MTLADIIILVCVGLIFFGIIYHMIKHKNEKVCQTCAYAKNKFK